MELSDSRICLRWMSLCFCLADLSGEGELAIDRESSQLYKKLCLAVELYEFYEDGKGLSGLYRFGVWNTSAGRRSNNDFYFTEVLAVEVLIFD